jgi:hypothetical protein
VSLTLFFGALAFSASIAAAQQHDVIVPIHQTNHSGVHGEVRLHAQGHGTMVRVNMFGGPEHLRPKLTLEHGRTCSNAVVAGMHPMPLNPVSSGQVSRTFVSIPLQSLSSSDFVVAVRDSTTRQQFAEGCAQLGR